LISALKIDYTIGVQTPAFPFDLTSPRGLPTDLCIIREIIAYLCVLDPKDELGGGISRGVYAFTRDTVDVVIHISDHHSAEEVFSVGPG